MAFIISKIDTEITFPAWHKANPSKNELTVIIKQDEINEVPDLVAERLTKARPHVYRYADEDEKPNAESPTEPEESVFNATEFLAENANNIEEALTNLSRRELFAICKAMKLGNYALLTSERIRERIIKDIKIQTAGSGEDETNNNNPEGGSGDE